MKWYWSAIKNYTNAKGRATRKEFWWFYAVNLLILCLLGFLEGMVREFNPSFGGEWFAYFSGGLNRGVFGTLYSLITLPAYICVTVRRFHDIGKSGRWYFLYMLPVVSLYCLYLLAKPTEPKVNPYGDPALRIAFCRKCGASVNRGSVFCRGCGLKLELPDSPEVSAPAQEVQPRRQKSAGNRKPWVAALCVVGAVVLVILFFRSGDGTAIMTPAEAAENVLYLELYDSSDTCIGSASGFLIHDGTMLVTNYHVIQDTYHMVAIDAESSREVPVSTVLAYDEDADLAILRCDGEIGVVPLTLADSDFVSQGDTVYAAGYPLGLANTLSNGIISSRYMEEQVDILQITAAISGGSSGGALLDEYGQVIGVISAYYEDGQNLNIAIAANEIEKLLAGDFDEVPLKQFYGQTSLYGSED